MNVNKNEKKKLDRSALLRSFRAILRYCRGVWVRLFGFNSADYWNQRYLSGGTSGTGSYGKLAAFKAEILNVFVKDNEVQDVIEFGCGDGAQLMLSDYPRYLGIDVSAEAIRLCREKFSEDASKTFLLLQEYTGERADVSMSLDVTYHLVEDGVFSEYMDRLFNASRRFVVIYSSNYDAYDPATAPHIRHRKITRWVDEQKSCWNLRMHIPNRFEYRGDDTRGSFADFYVYERSERSESGRR